MRCLFYQNSAYRKIALKIFNLLQSFNVFMEILVSFYETRDNAINVFLPFLFFHLCRVLCLLFFLFCLLFCFQIACVVIFFSLLRLSTFVVFRSCLSNEDRPHRDDTVKTVKTDIHRSRPSTFPIPEGVFLVMMKSAFVPVKRVLSVNTYTHI